MTFARNISIMAQGVGTTGFLSSAYGGNFFQQSVQASNFTAVSGNSYPVNTTSGAITVTLPASPSLGSTVRLIDYAGTFATNNVTVGGNGANINGLAANYLLNLKRESAAFVYIDATQGWLIYSRITISAPYSAPYLIVAGGGGGGGGTNTVANGGGGGAGGQLSGFQTFIPLTKYDFLVGAGGTSGSAVLGTKGNPSTGFSLSAIGGGYGAANGVGGVGGSGGGGGGAGVGGAGASGQGNAGGNAVGSGNFVAGGGGGAGTAGANGTAGTGLANSITGSSVTYAGGGGGGTNSTTANAGGTGGGGSSGRGAVGFLNGVAGTANTGGGGGGGATNGLGNSTGGAGGSGVIILSIPSDLYSGFTTGSTAVFTGAITTTTLTVASVASGTIAIGMAISGGGIAAGTTITAGSGLSWTVSPSQSSAVPAGTSITGYSTVVTTSGSNTILTFTQSGSYTA